LSFHCLLFFIFNLLLLNTCNPAFWGMIYFIWWKQMLNSQNYNVNIHSFSYSLT
jgi:hypothetical protein